MVTPLYRVRALTPAPALHSISVPFCSRLNRPPIFAVTPDFRPPEAPHYGGDGWKIPCRRNFSLEIPSFSLVFPFFRAFFPWPKLTFLLLKLTNRRKRGGMTNFYFAFRKQGLKKFSQTILIFWFHSIVPARNNSLICRKSVFSLSEIFTPSTSASYNALLSSLNCSTFATDRISCRYSPLWIQAVA